MISFGLEKCHHLSLVDFQINLKMTISAIFDRFVESKRLADVEYFSVSKRLVDAKPFYVSKCSVDTNMLADRSGRFVRLGSVYTKRRNCVCVCDSDIALNFYIYTKRCLCVRLYRFTLFTCPK